LAQVEILLLVVGERMSPLMEILQQLHREVAKLFMHQVAVQEAAMVVL
jgi:hypothetical protein